MTTSWPDLTSRLIAGQDLSSVDTSWAMDQVMNGQASPIQLAGFLTALASKGETTDELLGLADSMLSHATPVNVTSDSVDIVGTGGDRLKTVNISTSAALVIAACGVKVVKHGNRASSSASGSADCLEKLGINLDLDMDRVAKVFNDVGITFLFANLAHPSMRHAAVARRELGVMTAFNVLGPLTNPARPRAAAIGVSSATHAPLVAGVLAERGTQALVFRGDNGMDELSAVSHNHVWDIHEGEISESVIDAVRDLGMTPASTDDLLGGDASYNAGVTRGVFNGDTGIIRETIVVNAAAGLVADGSLISSDSLVGRLQQGMEIADEAISSGRVADLLDRWSQATQS